MAHHKHIHIRRTVIVEDRVTSQVWAGLALTSSRYYGPVDKRCKILQLPTVGFWHLPLPLRGRGGMCRGWASLIRPIRSSQRFWSTVSRAVPCNKDNQTMWIFCSKYYSTSCPNLLHVIQVQREYLKSVFFSFFLSKIGINHRSM